MQGTISAYVEFLRDVKDASLNTISSYTRDLTAFIAFLKSSEIYSFKEVDCDVLTQYTDKLIISGKSEATTIRAASVIHSFYNYLLNYGILKTNPLIGYKAIKSNRKLPDTLTQSEIELLLMQPTGNDFKALRDKAMLELLYATGIKVTELISLIPVDVSLEGGYIRCHDRQNERLIPIYPAAIKSLKTYFAIAKKTIPSFYTTKTIFLNTNGQHLTRQGCWKIIKSYVQSSGLTKTITFNTLRHTFALHLIENGADVKMVQEMLGHSDISTTQIYTKLIGNKYSNIYSKCHPRA